MLGAAAVLLVAAHKPPAPADPARFEEAVQAFRHRVPMTDAEFSDLEERAHTKAFMVTGIAQLDLVNAVWAALDKAISEGTTFQDFQAEVGSELESAWGREAPARIETIFRTNVQLAYGAGRVREMKEPAILKRRPFWRFSAIHDSRTSEICNELDGTCLPAEDLFWDTHQPPLHHGCRSDLVALTVAEADEHGVDDEGPDVEAAEGFGNVEDEAAWTPDTAKYPAPLLEAWRRRNEPQR